jgi:hypothetical protein
MIDIFCYILYDTGRSGTDRDDNGSIYPYQWIMGDGMMSHLFIPKRVTFQRFAWVPPCPECKKTTDVIQEVDGNCWWYCKECKFRFHH